MAQPAPLILASSSPRRREILERLGLAAEVVFPEADERRRPEEDAAAFALRVAYDKARSVSEAEARRERSAWVIGADTVVVVDGEPLGKPCDAPQARQMLTALSGREHRVLTGWVVLRPEGTVGRQGVEETRVWFKALRPAEIEAYVTTGEGADKAGAYGIQGIGCFLVERIEGNYENVVGLPACSLVEALLALDAIPGFPTATGRGPAR